MDKKLFLRRVAILLALVVGVIQMQMGGAVTATAYDFGASYETSNEDMLGSGAFSTDGSASAGTGVVSSSASASSSASNGGSYDFSLSAVGLGGIGGTRAQRDSFVRKTFIGLATGTYSATITVDVSSLSTPTSAASPGTLDSIDSNVGRRANFYPHVTNSRAYSFVQLGASGVDADGSPNNGVTATYVSTDGFGNQVLGLGSNVLTFSVTLDSPGAVIVEVHLIAEAWAAGNGSSASAACIADVVSIDLT